MKTPIAHQPRILLFDDEADIRELCTLILSSRGYAVSTCESSKDVLSAVDEVHPDLIFMDNWIPGVGGIEATRRIKAHPEYRNIPVVLLSANAELSLLARQAGADAYLPKPFDICDLEATIQRALGSANAAAA